MVAFVIIATKERDARTGRADSGNNARPKCLPRRLRNGVLDPHDLTKGVLRSAAISMGGFAFSVCALRLLRFIC